MNYPETIQYLYSRLPMFSSQGKTAIKPGLKNIISFCELLDNPHKKFKSVHIGGTNGKGSTSHMLAAILQTAGYKTGLYTSPHLRDFRERIKINGEMISEKSVIDFVELYKEHIEQIEPSFFETTVAMAFDHFAQKNIDVAVVEVGLGGRLDSTNLINPLLSVITNISLDHMNILGDTLQLIAWEKAGIIKAKVPVVIGERQDEISDVFINKAAETGSEIIFASDEWEVESEKINSQKTKAAGRDKKKDNENQQELLSVKVSPKTSKLQILKSSDALFNSSSQLLLDLYGFYQLKNLATVLSSVDQLRHQGFIISDDHVHKALKQVVKLTGLMGRWQTLSTRPLIICDTGHNENGISEVLKNIEATSFEKLHMVIGMVKDKDISKILKLLPVTAVYYFCQPDIPRAKDAIELKNDARSVGLTGKYYGSVKLALEAAKKNAAMNDLIFVGGSTFVVAEVV